MRRDELRRDAGGNQPLTLRPTGPADDRGQDGVATRRIVEFVECQPPSGEHQPVVSSRQRSRRREASSQLPVRHLAGDDRVHPPILEVVELADFLGRRDGFELRGA